MHFAWLSGAGIYHGGLNFGLKNSSPNGDENFVENKALLSYSKLSEDAEVAVEPSSMAVSEYHFLLLMGNKVKAEAAFSAKDFLRAASSYAKINYILSWITLKFISVNEQDALRTFLLRKLDNLAKDGKCQITMISTWATELYLEKGLYFHSVVHWKYFQQYFL